MRKKEKYKINRGTLDKEKRKAQLQGAKQRVALAVLPVIMAAVLAVGLYFGYISYQHSNRPNMRATVLQTASTKKQLTQNEKDILLTVINSANPVDSSYVPKLSEYEGVRISAIMTDDLSSLLSAAKKAGLDVRLISGYVSFEEQKELYTNAVAEYKKNSKSSTVKAEAYVKMTIPQPGECEQQTGLIVELGTNDDKNFEDTKEYHWLVKNCVNYGFVVRYPYEENAGGLKFSPYLYRYVGKEYAYYMRAYDMSLDEYASYLSVQ